jgi:hypothetical protein
MHKLLLAMAAGQVCGFAAVAWAFTDAGYRLFGHNQVPAALAIYVLVAVGVSRAILWFVGRRAAQQASEQAPTGGAG